MFIHVLPQHHLFSKYLLSSKLRAREFLGLWEYICKHIDESDITLIIRNVRNSKKGKLMVHSEYSPRSCNLFQGT